MLKKIKEYIKNIKKQSTKDKIFTILLLLTIIDVTIYISMTIYNKIDYSEKNKIYQAEKLTDQNISNKDLRLILNSTKEFEQNVVFVTSNDYTTPVIVLNDKMAIKAKKEFTPSLMKNTEKYLQDKNISFSWQENFENLNLEPTLKTAQFPISKYVSEHLLTLLIYGLLIFYLLKSMPDFMKSKYEIINPKDIEGSITELVGMEDIKKEIFQLKDMIENANKYELYGIKNVFNIIFSGPAGTGKTKIAGFLAKELNIPILVSSGNVETGYVGGGARSINSLFKKAIELAYNESSKTVIIFLDEAQVLLRKRGLSRDKWADDASNELLEKLDGLNDNNEIKIIFIAASNFDDTNMEIDEAMERRFQKKIYFRLPEKKERESIFKHFLSKIDSNLIKNIDYDYLASITVGLSGAKIETIVKEASLMSVQDLKEMDTDLLFKAFEKISLGLSTRDISEDQQEMRNIITIHELGHFITEYSYLKEKYGSLEYTKNASKLLKISSEAISKYNVLGFVLNKEEDKKLKRRKDLEEEIISLYGGYAAEEFFFEEASIGAHNDIEKVTKILEKMVFELGMYSDSKLNINLLELDKKDYLNKLNTVSENLYKISLNRIKENQKLIIFLQKILLEKWVLSKDELFDAIKEFESHA